MNRARKTAISPTRDEDYTEWYQQVIRAADLAETSAVRGCMVIKPWGYSLWENIQRVLDGMFKATGHQNAYFPLFIPLSFMQKEAEHVEGFAKECAVVTHHRLEAGPDGRLVPSGELTEPLVVRPTSETIIGATFAKWVQSYRDLPLLINQWANVVRWEMRPRIFLRTAEFLWQEGHTVHATAEDAQQETARMLGVYADFAERYMAIPVIKGEKTLSERFPGAVSTYSIEAMMQDRKALQAGTSHFLGQNFARSSEIRFSNPSGQEAYAWTTSWGVSTRLIGGLIMTHSDDNGLILPPKLAPRHVVILPLLRKDTNRAEILAYCESLAQELRALRYKGNPADYLREDERRIPFDDDQPLQVELDVRDASGGEKVWSWIKKGVPIRLEIGQRELEGNTVFVGRRDRQQSERVSQSRAEFVATVSAQLDDIQHGLFDRARRFRDQHTQRIDSKADLYDFFTPHNRDKPEIHAGFALSHWNGQPDVEETIKNDLNVTIRCIPIDAPEEDGSCVLSGQASTRRVVFAKSY